MNDSQGSRPSVEEIMKQAEGYRLSPKGIQEAFEDESAPVFADQTDAWLPDSQFVHDQMLRLLAPTLEDGGRVLDLGAGTGRLAKVLLDRFPSAEVTLADFSQTMLDEVPKVLASHDGRYEVVKHDFLYGGTALPGHDYDAVVSGFSIHHAIGENAYRRLYSRILDSLQPGGIFVNLDHVAGATRSATIENASAWRDFLDQSGNIPTDRFLLGTFAEDYPIPLEAHIRLMRGVGFINVDVIWKKAIFALYAGTRP